MISADSPRLSLEIIQGSIDEYDELILNLTRKRAALRVLLEHMRYFEPSLFDSLNDKESNNA